MIPADPSARRIVLLLDDFTGAAARTAVRLASRWAVLGRRVIIFCGAETGAARWAVDEEIEVRVIAAQAAGRELHGQRLGRAAAGLLGDIAADVVISPGGSHAPAILGLKLGGGPGGPPAVCMAREAAGIRWLMRGADMLVTTTPAVARDAIAVMGGDRVACIGEPIAEDDWMPPARNGRRCAAAWLTLLDGLVTASAYDGVAVANQGVGARRIVDAVARVQDRRRLRDRRLETDAA